MIFTCKFSASKTAFSWFDICLHRGFDFQFRRKSVKKNFLLEPKSLSPNPANKQESICNTHFLGAQVICSSLFEQLRAFGSPAFQATVMLENGFTIESILSLSRSNHKIVGFYLLQAVRRTLDQNTKINLCSVKLIRDK